MLTIHSHVYSIDTTSLENGNRIKYPVQFLNENGVPTLSSELINIDNSINLLYKYNSKLYLDKFVVNPDFTICNHCTTKNVVINKKCKRCKKEFNKNIRILLDNDPDTLITIYTQQELEEVSKVLNFLVENYNHYQNAYALIRPPGHHAYTEHNEGFCIVNNAYILASELLEKKIVNKVLIYDWDLHHGNGTQECVLSSGNSNIFFLSTHFYSPTFYPRTGNNYLYDPEEKSLSNVYNFPLNKSMYNVFSEYFEENIVPLLDKICAQTDLIIISNGLDAHKNDPFDKLNFTDEDYIYMTTYFKSKNQKIIFLLEGGYNAEIIARLSLGIINLFRYKN